jgi:hypothetical protein
MERQQAPIRIPEATLKPARVEVLLNASAGAIEQEGRDKLHGNLEAAFAKHGISARLEFLKGADLRSSRVMMSSRGWRATTPSPATATRASRSTTPLLA